MTVHDPNVTGSTPAPAPEFDRKQALKLLVDLGPLLAFAIAYVAGRYLLPNPAEAIYLATGVLMAATLLSLVAAKLLFGQIDPMLKFTAALVAIFGTLTLVLHDDKFIKMKPTILYAFFSAALFIGLAMGRYFLKQVFSHLMPLTDAGWRLLTLRWATFFLCLAALNEFVWRNFPEWLWALFKFPGVLILTMIFAAAQIGLMKKYEAS